MLEGIVVRASPARPLVMEAAFRCKWCNTITHITQSGPFLTAPTACSAPECRRKSSFDFVQEESGWMTLIPTIYNADTLGIRPDLIGRPISNWSELLNPEFKGKASILDISSIGIMDMAMVVESMGEYTYPDKGNMTKEEIDLTIGIFTEAKKNGQFRAFWKSFDESVNLMASGEVVIQSMWSPAITVWLPGSMPARKPNATRKSAWPWTWKKSTFSIR